MGDSLSFTGWKDLGQVLSQVSLGGPYCIHNPMPSCALLLHFLSLRD
jgi:hypothetical protein